jgi:pimeloyl-ACP methyl ester carboxylesterase
MDIVLVHGGSQGGWAWDSVSDLLRAKGNTVFAPTLKGMGDGSVDRIGVTAGDMAHDLVSMIRQWGLKEVVLVGHSGGGAIVQLAVEELSDGPVRVKRVVFAAAAVLLDGECLVDAAPPEVKAAVDPMFSGPDSSVPTPVGAWSHYAQDADPELARYLSMRGIATPLGWFTHVAQLKRFWENQPPASYIAMTEDRVATMEFCRHHSGRLRNSRFIRCAGSHQAMLTRPEDFAEAVCAAIADSD